MRCKILEVLNIHAIKVNVMNTLIISSVRKLFLSGEKLTAKEINKRIGFNDARKIISTLRAKGMNIQDIRLPNNCKLYWLANTDTQLSFLDNNNNYEIRQ